MQRPPDADAVADAPGPHRMRGLAGRLQAILWPAFITACGLEFLIFAIIDPATLHPSGAATVMEERTAVYSVTFIVLWFVVSAWGLATRSFEE